MSAGFLELGDYGTLGIVGLWGIRTLRKKDFGNKEKILAPYSFYPYSKSLNSKSL